MRKKWERDGKEMVRRGMCIDNLGDRIIKRRNRSMSVHSGQSGVRQERKKHCLKCQMSKMTKVFTLVLVFRL